MHVSKEDVQAELGRIKEGSNKPRFLVSEIFEPVDTPEQDAKVHKDMDDLANQISLGSALPGRRTPNSASKSERRPKAAISAGCRKVSCRQNSMPS